MVNEALARDCNKRFYYNHKNNGLCTKCPTPVSDGKVLCEQCRLLQSLARLRKKENSVCVYCTEQALEGKITCANCAHNGKAVHDLRKQQKICVDCRTDLDQDYQYTLCKVCKKDRADKASKLRASRRLSLRCIRCPNEPLPGVDRCKICWFKSGSYRIFKTYRKWNTLEDILIKQNFTCPYLGLPLTIGVNAQIDHIVAKSKGGTDEVSNLQFVHTWANAMKLQDSEGDFLRKLDSLLPTIFQFAKTKRGLKDAPS